VLRFVRSVWKNETDAWVEVYMNSRRRMHEGWVELMKNKLDVKAVSLDVKTVWRFINESCV
jgi:hypothetical protein